MTKFNYGRFEKDITESLYSKELHTIEQFLSQYQLNTESIELTKSMFIKGMAAIEFASRFQICTWNDETPLRKKLQETLKKVDVASSDNLIQEGDIFRAFGILQIARLLNRKLNSGQLDVALCEIENGDELELILNAASFISEIKFANKSVETGRQGAMTKNRKYHEVKQYVIYRYLELKKEGLKISKCAEVIFAELIDKKSHLLNVVEAKMPSDTFRKWIYDFNDGKLKLDPKYAGSV